MLINSFFLWGRNFLKKKSILILISILVLIVIIVFLIFFYINTSKNSKIGNNSSSQEIVDYILNISSYDAKIEVEVNSNKNTNKYIINQKYEKPDVSIQEVIEPSNIAGVKITKNGNELKIENTKLNLNSIFQDYEYVSDNSLDLSAFIENYKSDEKANWIEENDEIIMITNKSKKEKKLYIEKSTRKTYQIRNKRH